MMPARGEIMPAEGPLPGAARPLGRPQPARVTGKHEARLANGLP